MLSNLVLREIKETAVLRRVIYHLSLSYSCGAGENDLELVGRGGVGAYGTIQDLRPFPSQYDMIFGWWTYHSWKPKTITGNPGNPYCRNCTSTQASTS